MPPSPSPAWDLDLLAAAFRESAAAWDALQRAEPVDARRAEQVAAYNAAAAEALLAKGPAGRDALLALLDAVPGPLADRARAACRPEAVAAPSFDEHDVVRLLRDLPDEGVAHGEVGTIVHVHAVRGFVAYEVEFPRGYPAGRPIVLTIAEADLVLVWPAGVRERPEVQP